MNVPTIKERADNIYRKLGLVIAAVDSMGGDLDPDHEDMIVEIKELCDVARGEAFSLMRCDLAETPVPEQR